MNKSYPIRSRNIERLYSDADKSFVINFGSKRLKPIRISLPTPPPLNSIDGYGKHPDDQFFRRLDIPKKLLELQLLSYEYCKNQRKDYSIYDVLEFFWKNIKNRHKEFKNEIIWIKHFIWHMHYGYWFYNDGKPTYITGWNFSYLNCHWMTLRKGEGYPEYDERQRRRFLFRKYTYETDETFADLDEKGNALKVDGKYRMVKTGTRTFFGTVEPKGRREGLTNEFVHIVCRIMSETRGHDNLGTIVSLDGDNAKTHFSKKLVPAFKKWHLWIMPIWKGGITDIVFEAPKSVLNPEITVLGSTINYTPSGGDLANDGKKIMAAGFDEQGKGKRTGDVRNRWQINKETMSQEAGADVLGWCSHPSTVEKMEEGGQDYKEMNELSDFYNRNEIGQTVSGLAVSYMPTSFCLRGFIDRFGNPVLHRPTERQKELGYKKSIGSQTYIQKRRRELFDEKDPKKMDEYNSFVRKFPEDYDDCWRNVTGVIGFPVDAIDRRIQELVRTEPFIRGKLVWVNNVKFGSVKFEEDENGSWLVSSLPKEHEANLKSTIDYFSAIDQATVPMFRPLYPSRGIVGIDPHEFTNKSESVHLKSKGSKLSDTGIVVFRKRDKRIDTNDFDRKTWKTQNAIACLDNSRITSNYGVAEEALKAAIFWGYLINLERNKTEVWSHIIKWHYGGYLNHRAEYLPTGGVSIDPEPGTYLTGLAKKRVFSLAADQFKDHVEHENLIPLLKQASQISSMEELTKYDILAGYMAALDGARSIYGDMMEAMEGSTDGYHINIQGRAV